MTKPCTLCGEQKTADAFVPDKRRKDGRGSHCRSCANHLSAAYYRKSGGRYNDVRKRYRAMVRASVLTKYGGHCACCGLAEPMFLGIDHIHGGGNAERALNFGYAFYLKLYKAERRDDLQVLCHNCNFAKGMYGLCPHRT